MQAMTTFDERSSTIAQAARAAATHRARPADELYEFRRYNYADGWDSDDAALGWVDDEIVRGSSRRLH